MTGRRSVDGRRGLVLGAGGVLGFAWMIGALAALEAEEGFDARDVEICVGTSAGSILAALLGSGVSVETMLRHQQGIPIPGDFNIDWDYDRDSGGALPPRPRLGLGSPELLRRAARHPLRVPPLATLSAVLPRGRGTLEPLRRMIDRAARGLPAAGTRPPWPLDPQVWVIAMDYSAGRRVAFGRDGSPPATLAAAVTASCAIPGWYAPSVIDGRRYVDGGTTSPTSVDLLAGRGLTEVYVLAPMISFAYDRPSSPVARAERRLRRTVTRRVLNEATRVRRAGTEVTLLGPGPADLQVIGANLMDPRRRAAVLATSLRTSPEALRRAGGSGGRSHRTGTAGR